MLDEVLSTALYSIVNECNKIIKKTFSKRQMLHACMLHDYLAGW